MSRSHHSGPLAFTLIELLIVVSIIAILAAIAVPNLLEAQTRSKVSRVHSDLRSCATAIESYAIDHNTYPSYGNPKYDEIEGPPGPSGLPPVEAYIPIKLTTPIAYFSSLPMAVFRERHDGLEFEEPYRYMSHLELLTREPDEAETQWAEKMIVFYGAPGVGKEWEVFSYGPDHVSDDGSLAYDPTNGTTSRGDICRFGP